MPLSKCIIINTKQNICELYKSPVVIAVLLEVQLSLDSKAFKVIRTLIRI